jgi:hypothetical protein
MSKTPRRVATLVAASILTSLALGGVAHAGGGATTASTTGSGTYSLLGTTPAAFEFAAVVHENGTVGGDLHVSTVFQGFLIEFTGDVTCVTDDPVNHRAWIGGVITSNSSTHVSFTTPRTQVGEDIWFRVVDYGEGNGAPPDRSTFVGFAGDAEIQTSLEYCAVQPWPADDARTWAVTDGNIQVHD